MVQQAPSRGPEHPVYSLRDNRLSAHLVRSGGLLVHGGSPGFAKYMRYRFKGPNWKVAETVDGAKASIIEGSTGRIDVPLTAAQAKGPVKIKMHVHNEGDRRVGFRVNGNKDKEVTVEVTAGWTTAEVEIPDGAFHEGDNEILMFTSKGSPMAVGWMQIGGDTSAEPTTDFAAANSLVLPKDGGLAYHVIVPDKGLVAGDLSDPKCKVEVSAEPDDGEAITGTLTGKGSAVDLSKLAGEVVRLELIGAGCDRAELADAALVVPGEAPTYARKPAKPKYVILWVMDSLRADRVRVFNPDAPAEVPTFEKLVGNSTVFTHNYVQGNESKASHASIWSSLYPVNHRYYQKKNKFVVDAQKIDAAMKKAGFYTSGVSGNGYIIPRRGFGDSWDAFRNHIHDPGGLKGQEILDPALESVEGKTDPWFLYIGTIDTHVSWRAKEPWMSKLDPEPYSGRFKTTASGPDVGKIVGGGIKVNDRDIKRIRALYNSNVSYQDDLVRQLFDKLEEWGIADETMVIITADHGDEQFEVSNRRVGHGTSLRETLVWVPLVIHYPPLFPAGKVNTGTEVVDILPTLADVLGFPMNDHWQGQSLLPLANGVGQDYPRMSFASQYEEAHTARVRNWKYEYGRSGAELFDLKAEPLEKTNLADNKPYAYQMMSDAFWMLRMWNRDWKKSEWGNALNVTPEFAAAVSK
jgi:arylsulfatase A-like enzyme